MTKSDLKTGMKVVTREGVEFIVLKDCTHCYGGNTNESIIVSPTVNSHNWNLLSYYKDDLTYHNNSEYDIMAVYTANHPYDIFYPREGWTLTWERIEPITLKYDLNIKVEKTGDLEKILSFVKLDLIKQFNEKKGLKP